MSNVVAALPRKSMTKPERQLLQVLADQLLGSKSGSAVMATMLVLLASWMGSPSTLGFEDFARRWLAEGNAKDKAAEQVLKDVFGLVPPEAV